MDRVELLMQINLIVYSLHGKPVKEDSIIVTESRLQKYALVILFYQLNKIWNFFNINYVEDTIINFKTYKNIIDDIITYENT